MTTDWRLANTAPPDTPVELGRWRKTCGETGRMEWGTAIGFVWKTEKTRWGGTRTERHFLHEEYTHWRPLPEPPTGEQT
jgi:hypothetical protein